MCRGCAFCNRMPSAFERSGVLSSCMIRISEDWQTSQLDERTEGLWGKITTFGEADLCRADDDTRPRTDYAQRNGRGDRQQRAAGEGA
jgi:hypothetical protein